MCLWRVPLTCPVHIESAQNVPSCIETASHVPFACHLVPMFHHCTRLRCSGCFLKVKELSETHGISCLLMSPASHNCDGRDWALAGCVDPGCLGVHTLVHTHMDTVYTFLSSSDIHLLAGQAALGTVLGEGSRTRRAAHEVTWFSPAPGRVPVPPASCLFSPSHLPCFSVSFDQNLPSNLENSEGVIVAPAAQGRAALGGFESICTSAAATSTW